LEFVLPNCQSTQNLNNETDRIFLTVTGVLRVLIDSNKKLILHMLKSLIQRDEYFVSKGDHVISSHAKILFE
jgi:hypothetical protein